MESPEAKQLAVLVVEDDVVDKKHMERLLTVSLASGYHVEFADRLAKALTLLAEREFDILLLDLNLPDSAGLNTLEAVKKEYPNLAIVVVTSGENEALGLEAVTRGAQDYLIKDVFNARALARVVHYSVERKKSERTLWESRGKLNAILESIGDPMIMLDKDLSITWSNEACRRAFGDHGAGKKCWELFHGKETPCEQVANVAREAFEDGRPHSCEVEVVNAAGQTRYFHCTANAALRDEYGAPTAVIEIARDMTDRKSAEIIKAAYAKVEKANRELREMQSQLVQSEKLASIGQLAAGVAHEMNTPVGFIACNFETLQGYMMKLRTLLDAYDQVVHKIESSGNHEHSETVQGIRALKSQIRLDFILQDLDGLFEDSREGLERVTNIIRNLRDFARADRTSDFMEYSINEGIRTTLTVARNEIKYDADIKTEFGDIPPIFCNAGQLNQVFLNLLVNAAQAVKSQQRQTKGTITIRTYVDEAHVVCDIEDDGPGIPAANLQRIFDPFFTTKPPGKGTGLGLSVSYDIIVNKHKGLISVESELNRGTRFTIKLPLTSANIGAIDREEAFAGVESNVGVASNG